MLQFKKMIPLLIFVSLLGFLARCTLASIDGEGASVGGVSSNGNGTVTVTINGSGFVTGVSVTISAKPCVDVKILSATQLTCIIAETVPIADIVITYPSSGGGGSGGGGGGSGGGGGLTFQTAFVTSTYHYPNFGGLEPGDTICATQASLGSATSSLLGRWRAILSDSTGNASSRIILVSGGAVKNTNGETVVANSSNLWSGTILNFIRYDEGGSLIGGGGSIWTGSTSAGVSTGTHCINWTNAVLGNFGGMGTATSTNSFWIDNLATQACNVNQQLYCINSNE